MGHIVVVTDLKNRVMVMGNNELFRFLDIKDINEFKNNYNCICDLFVEKEGFLQKENDGVYWIEYLEKNQGKVHKVLIPHGGKEYLYFVDAKFLDVEKTMAISVFTNITDLKVMDDKIANELKIEALNEMIINISHHWRQPLSLISMLAGTILVNIEMEMDNKEQIIKLSTNIIKTAKDISSMLDIFSNRIENNLNMDETILLNDLVKLLEFHFKEELDKFHIVLNVTVANVVENKIVSKILFDVQKEIIQNSIDILKDIADKDDKAIFINISSQMREVIFDIYDNGGGVSEKNIGKIFDPYFTTYHQSKGKGLGLYFVRNTIHNLMDGEILVQNKSFLHNNKECTGLQTIIKIGFVN
jgi:nitrogen fixation/metabolism regulation signal transduction histidine kinase